MKLHGSVAAVVAAIREDAGAEAQRIEAEAAQKAQELLAPPPPAEAARREERLAAARRQARDALAREDWEDARAALQAREQFIARAVAQGEALLAAPEPAPERRALLVALAREAIEQLPEGDLIASFAPGDAALLEVEDLRALGPRTRVRADPDVPSGCVVGTPDGRATFDNTLADRARRFETAWRAALAKVIEP